MKKTFLLLVGIVCSCLVWGETITIINTIDDLAGLATDIEGKSGYDGQTIEIKADLVVSKIWTPIGTAAQPFQGKVKGNGHIISGLGAIKGTDGLGVFGYVGEKATIEDLGIGTGHIKTMKNDVCQYIGSLVGHNAGTINRCWNMATIEVNGTNVGGLVGWNEGQITDCYNAGPITKATDSIGGLVGANKGKISYCYNIGFVRNGLGLVAQDEGGTITEGYYDRQLYIQSPDAEHRDPTGVVAKDKTLEMFTLFSSRNVWTNSADNYPILTKFKDHEAAQVSVASIDVTNNGGAEPDNHLNQLVSDFRVSLSHDVTWEKISPINNSWIVQDPQNQDVWNVNRPCRTTEVMMTAGKNGHVREIIAIPMHIEDFLPGSWGGDSIMACLNEPLYIKDISLKKNDDPSGGKPEYRVKLVITRLADNVDTTIIEQDSWNKFVEAYINQSWTPTKPGYYMIKRYAADSQCHIEWEESDGQLPVFVPDTLKPGKIQSGNLSKCHDESSLITINSIEEALCEGTTISYYWTVNSNEIEGQTGATLTKYQLSAPGQYTFKRYAYNDGCEPKDKAKAAENEYTVTVFKAFEPGSIRSDSIVACSVEDALQQLSKIEGAEATGGDGTYTYTWDMYEDKETRQLEGEVGKDLDLTDYVTMNARYVFTRKAQDGYCVVEGQACEGKVVIEIYGTITAGQIESKTIDKTCISSEEKEIKVEIASLRPATTERGKISYIWYMVVNGYTSIVSRDSESLSFTLSLDGLSKETEFMFYRTAYNSSCGSAEVRADGETKMVVSFAEAIDKEIIICESQFVNGKYTYAYPSSEKPHKQVVFDLNDLQPQRFTDDSETSTCPSVVTLTPVVIPVPEIQTENNVVICQDRGDGTLTLYFQMVKGSADMYDIKLSESLRPYFDNQTYISGIMPRVKEGEIGEITLYCKHISYHGGEKDLYLQVGLSSKEEGLSPCLSAASKIKLTVTQGGYIENKYDKVLFIDNNPKKETDPKFTAYQWYKNGFIIEGATGQYYHEGGATLVGSYFADLTYIENGKEMVMRTCTLQLPVESGKKVGAPTSDVTKQLEDGQIVIQRAGAKYTIFGNKLSNL